MSVMKKISKRKSTDQDKESSSKTSGQRRFKLERKETSQQDNNLAKNQETSQEDNNLAKNQFDDDEKKLDEDSQVCTNALTDQEEIPKYREDVEEDSEDTETNLQGVEIPEQPLNGEPLSFQEEKTFTNSVVEAQSDTEINETHDEDIIFSESNDVQIPNLQGEENTAQLLNVNTPQSSWKPLFPTFPGEIKETSKGMSTPVPMAPTMPPVLPNQPLPSTNQHPPILKKTQRVEPSQKKNVETQKTPKASLKQTDRLILPQPALNKRVAPDISPKNTNKLLRSILKVLLLVGLLVTGFYFRHPLWNKISAQFPMIYNKQRVGNKEQPETKTKEHSSTSVRAGWFGEKMPIGMSIGKKRGEYVWEKDQSIMVYVAPGDFLYYEGPKTKNKKKVFLPGYYIDKYEVTNEQYNKFIKATKRAFPSSIPSQFKSSKQPMVGITWHDAYQYALWAGKRLPIDTEWMKAARGGFEIPDWDTTSSTLQKKINPKSDRRYPWGDETPLPHHANYKAASDGYDNVTASVGSFPKGTSPYGCEDMSGNVSEWCAQIPEDPSKLEICRGGSWRSNYSTLLSTISHPKNYSDPSIGVRLICPSDNTK